MKSSASAGTGLCCSDPRFVADPRAQGVEARQTSAPELDF